jgi:hypothetical protein
MSSIEAVLRRRAYPSRARRCYDPDVESRLARSAAAALVGVAAVACVVWPAGTGPEAKPLPLDDALGRVARHEAVLVDVRTREAYAEGHIPRAVNVPADELVARAAELRRMGLPILYCG